MTDVDLAKMGSARVKLVVGADGMPKAIEKEPVSEVEYAFYRDAAPLLAQLGILTPVVKSACYEQRKLVLEYIPEPSNKTLLQAMHSCPLLHDYILYRLIPHGRSAHISGMRQHLKAASPACSGGTTVSGNAEAQQCSF